MPILKQPHDPASDRRRLSAMTVHDSHNFTHTCTVSARSLSTCSGVVGCKRGIPRVSAKKGQIALSSA